MRRLILLAAPLTLAACVGPFAPQGATGPTSTGATPEARPETLDPTPPPPPPRSATTAEQFDTTSAEDRAEAAAATESAGEERLGTTIASLGDPSDPGFWLKTPLVSELTPGRVEYPTNGKSANVELRPSGGDPGGGSQLSLPAMRLLEAPLTGLPEIVVYSGGDAEVAAN